MQGHDDGPAAVQNRRKAVHAQGFSHGIDGLFHARVSGNRGGARGKNGADIHN
jgi:hypothetical protein